MGGVVTAPVEMTAVEMMAGREERRCRG